MLIMIGLPEYTSQPQKYVYKWQDQKCFTNVCCVVSFYVEQAGQTERQAQKSIEVI